MTAASGPGCSRPPEGKSLEKNLKTEHLPSWQVTLRCCYKGLERIKHHYKENESNNKVHVNFRTDKTSYKKSAIFG